MIETACGPQQKAPHELSETKALFLAAGLFYWWWISWWSTYVNTPKIWPRPGKKANLGRSPQTTAKAVKLHTHIWAGHPFLWWRTRLKLVLSEQWAPNFGAQTLSRLDRRQLWSIAKGSYRIMGKRVIALFSYLFSYCWVSELQKPSLKTNELKTLSAV